MASTTENIEIQSDLLSQETGEIPEESEDKTSSGIDKNEVENGVEDSSVDDRISEEANEEVKVDKEDEMIGLSTKEGSVVVEEKDVVEVSDEAKSNERESVESNETVDIPRDDQNERSEMEDKMETEETKTEPHGTDEQEKWIDLLGNGLLTKKILKQGIEDSFKPIAGQEVCVSCEGALPNGDKVDVNRELKFIIGDGDVITALDLCVPTMLQQEICELVTAPRFAYGTFGKEDDGGEVPPDSEMTYTLELLSVNPGPDVSKLTDEQRIALGDQKRERGNDLFRREEYSLALHSYTRALKYLGSSMSEPVVDLKVKCWNNISASHLKVREYDAAKNACDSVLEIDPNNVKALFRKGKVLDARGEYEESLELLRKSNSLDPENKLIRKELHAVRQKYEENKQKERTMYQRMVGGLLGDPQPEANNTFFTWPVILGITGATLGGIVAALYFSRH